MKKLSYSFVSVILFFLYGCVTTHNVTLDTLQQPAISLPNNIQKVIFLYNMPHQASQTYDETANAISDTTLVRHIMLGATDKLAEAPFIVPALNNLVLPIKSSQLLLIFDSICKQYDADAIVYINQYKWNNNLSQAAHYIPEYDMYYASQVVLVQADWKIYDRYTQQYVDQYIQRDTSYWEAYSTSPSEVAKKLPVLQVAVPSALYSSGEHWAIRYSPSWTTSNRFYYETNNKKMKEASVLAEQGKWTEAAKIWTEIVYNTKSSRMLTAKAAFNRALAAEMADNIEAALEWASKSHFYNDDFYTNLYIEILERRKAIKKKIEGLYPSSKE